MIKEVTTSDYQIDTNTYLPMVLVKNGLVSYLTSNGIIDTSKQTSIKIPDILYDSVLKMVCFTKTQINGVDTYEYSKTKYLSISIYSTEIYLLDVGYAYLETTLITKQG